MERNATSGMSIGNGLGLGLERLAHRSDGTSLSADERRELWDRLEAFALDDIDSHAPFSARLAREQGWSRSFARRVIEEYKKFLYVGCVGEHPVTPSEQVDAAWHLHLIYTRSYWDDLCARVLRRPFHHGPSKGGAKEDKKYQDWYERTLAAYEVCFGCKAPADIWPAADERFATRARWVDLNTHWVIPKRLGWLAGKRAGVVGGVGVASLAMAGCGVTLGQAGGSTPGMALLFVGLGVILFCIVAAIVTAFSRGASQPARRHRRGSGTDGFTPMVFFGSGGEGHRHDAHGGVTPDVGQGQHGDHGHHGHDGNGGHGHHSGGNDGGDGGGSDAGGGGDGGGGGGGGGDGGGGGCGGGGCGGG